MASRSYTLPTIKTLFAEANQCAFPGCAEPLIFDDRGAKTVVAEIAHIRSESVTGPRHDPTYMGDVDGHENLLLLCGKHHKPVDRHESTYPVDELLGWKQAQIEAAAGTAGTPISNEEARQLSATSPQVLATMDNLARLATLFERACGATRTHLNQIEVERREALRIMRLSFGPMWSVAEDGTRTNMTDQVEMSRVDADKWQARAQLAYEAGLPAIDEALIKLDAEANVLRMRDPILGGAANRVKLAAEAARSHLGNEEVMDRSIEAMHALLRAMWLEANVE